MIQVNNVARESAAAQACWCANREACHHCTVCCALPVHWGDTSNDDGMRCLCTPPMMMACPACALGWHLQWWWHALGALASQHV